MEKNELPKDVAQLIESGELEKVAGGYVFNVSGSGTKRWEVIDDGDGHVVGRYATKDEAIEMASKKGQSTKRIYWEGDDGLWSLRHS